MTKAQWQRLDRDRFKAQHGYSKSAHYSTGGLRQQILDRDGRRCVRCGLTDEEHKARWGRPITIDHKDRNRQHNTPDNLQTLCLRCHGSKDLLPQLKISETAIHKEAILTLRSSGWSCNKIAIKYGVGCRVITKWLRRWQEGKL